MLNSDIDMIEEKNKQIADEIKYHLSLQSMSDSDKNAARENLSKQIKETNSSNNEKIIQVTNIET